MTALSITKTNVRYITGSASRKDGAVVSIKFRVFAESKEIIADFKKRLVKLTATGVEGTLTSSKYSGWDLKQNVHYVEYSTKNRAEFQDAFKVAKKAAIEASRVAREAVTDSEVAKIAKAVAGTAKTAAVAKKGKGKKK